MYKVSNEIKEKIKEVLGDSNISNEEKKSIIVDIFANLFGVPPMPAQQGSSDDSVEYDPEYAAGYNLGKWFAAETYKNYGHEPNTENMIDIPRRERMKILESAGQKLPKDQRLFDIIGNGLTVEEKIQLIIDLFMEPDDSQNQQQNQQGQQNGQQNQQSQQNQQQNQQSNSADSGEDSNEPDDGGSEQGNPSQQQNQQNNGGDSGEDSNELDAGGSEGGEQDKPLQQQNQLGDNSNQQNGSRGDAEQDEPNTGERGAGSSDNDSENGDTGADEDDSVGSGSGDEQEDLGPDEKNGSSPQNSPQNQQGTENGTSSSSGQDENQDDAGEDGESGKSAQEELDDLLNSDKASEENSSNNDFDFGDDVFGNDHVISQEDGEKIRQSENAKVSETDKNFGEDGEVSIEMIDELYGEIEAKLTAEEKEIVQKINGDLKQKVQRAKKGIINWKKLLRKFMNSYADVYEKGGMRKNLYKMSGIELHHPKPLKQMKKCVVYIDTSGSVNNEQTQLVPLMLAEIGKIAKDCGFSAVDVNLFHHTVYTDTDNPDVVARTKNIKPSTTVRKDWGILAQDGGTNIQEVYRSIERNYTQNGKLKQGVATIIIITDVEGVMDSGTVSNFIDKFDKSVFKKMVYVIYDRYKDIHKGQLETEVDKVLSPYSSHIEIGLRDFKKQIKARFTNESNNIHMRRRFINEASLADRRKARDEQKAIVQSGDTEKINDVLRKDAIAGGRLLGVGANDRYFKPIKDIIKNHFPELQETNDGFSLSKGGLYYITDDMNVRIGINIDKTNIERFAALCITLHDEVGCKIEEIFGNVTFKLDPNFVSFPVYFPDVVNGKLTLTMLKNMKSFANAPTRVIEASINVNKEMVKQQRVYINTLRKNGAKVDSISLADRTFDSVQHEVERRLRLAESYMNESMPDELGKMILPSYRSIGKADNDKRAELESTRAQNRIVFDVLRKDYGIDWGNLPNGTFDINEDSVKVREDLEAVLRGSSTEAVKRYNKIVDEIMKTSKVINKHNSKIQKLQQTIGRETDPNKIQQLQDEVDKLQGYVDDLGVKNDATLKTITDDELYRLLYNLHDGKQSHLTSGLRIYTDRTNKISMVILVSDKKIENRQFDIICLVHNGKVITDVEKIYTFIKERRRKYIDIVDKNMVKYGIARHEVVDTQKTIREFLVRLATVIACNFLGVELNPDPKKEPQYKYTRLSNLPVFDKPGQFSKASSRNEYGYKILSVLWGCSVQDVKSMDYGNFVFRGTPAGKITISQLIRHDQTKKRFYDSIPETANIAALFDDDFLRFILNCLDVFNENDVANFTRGDLVDLVNRAANNKLENTLLGRLQGIDAAKEDFQFNALTLFADKVFKVINLKLPYDLVKSKFNEFKMYRDIFDGGTAHQDREKLKGNLVDDKVDTDELTRDEKMIFTDKNRKSIKNIIDLYASRNNGQKVDIDIAIKEFTDTIAPEFMEYIEDYLEYIKPCISKEDVKRNLRARLNILTQQEAEEFEENIYHLIHLYDAILKNAKTIMDRSNNDIIRHSLGIVLETSFENIESIVEHLSNILSGNKVADNVKDINNLLVSTADMYTEYVMMGKGSAMDVLKSIWNRTHKYAPVSKRIARRPQKAQAVSQQSTNATSNISELGDVYKEYATLLPDFISVIENVDISTVQCPPKMRTKYNNFVDNIDDMVDTVASAVTSAKSSNNETYAGNIMSDLKDVLSSMKSIIDNANNSSAVVRLSVIGRESISGIVDDMESIKYDFDQEFNVA